MIRKYIIEADDSIKGFDGEIAKLEREWGAEEIEPCKDCLSRKAVNILVDELARAISDERCCISRGRSTATIMQDIINLSSVTPQQTRWIPVSERLPKDFEDVLIWYEYFRYGDYNRMFETYGIGCYISSTGTWSGDAGIGSRVKVFAWMPLPEPYEAESEGEK